MKKFFTSCTFLMVISIFSFIGAPYFLALKFFPEQAQLIQAITTIVICCAAAVTAHFHCAPKKKRYRIYSRTLQKFIGPDYYVKMAAIQDSQIDADAFKNDYEIIEDEVIDIS